MTPGIKCVVFDLDGTVWDGIALEAPAGERPEPRPEMLAAMWSLHDRGMLLAVASRTDPSLRLAVLDRPGLGDLLVTAEVSWDDKSRALRLIADELGIAVATLAFVDDDRYERAEVRAALPEVLVLTPDEFLASLDALAPGPATEGSRRRLEYYRQEQARRRAEESFAGSPEQFQRWCAARLTLAEAQPSDVERLVELAGRTNRFNTTGEHLDAATVAALVTDPDWFLPVARFADRFGEYGLVGAALVRRTDPTWWVRLLMVSCRAAGRGVPAALLREVLLHARDNGARCLRVELRVTEANAGLRVVLRAAGLRAAGGTMERSLETPPPGPVAALAIDREYR